MKTTLITAATALILLVGSFKSTSAQNCLTMHLPLAPATVPGATFTALADQAMLVRYTEKQISYKAYYNKDGAWLYTVASYEKSSLPKSVSYRVQSAWHGWNVSFVDEVRAPGVDPVYRVQLRRIDRLTIVRVSGDDMDIESEFTNK